MRPEIARALREELWEMDIPGARLRSIRDKDGVVVCRVFAEGRRYILKYFERPEFRREIRNYQILAFADIPTVEVFLYTDRSILMEDIEASRRLRPGRAEDCADPAVARLVARWYRLLHDRGADAADLPSLFRESDSLAAESVGTLRERLGPFPGEELLSGLLPKLRAAIDALPRTLCYNDFDWSNLAVEKDGSGAFLFDYNLLGQGYRYADLRNVRLALGKAAGEAFLAEYGPVAEAEKLVDEAAAPLVALAAACKRETFPDWAEDSLRALRRGEVAHALRRLLG